MWDIRYRPLKFTDVLGQNGAVQVLKARLKNKTALDTNYIFSGGPGQGKCVTGGTLIPTDKGLIPIETLMGPNQIDPSGRTILQETGTATAAYTYRGGRRETIRVRTHRGFELEGTPNHRILVLSPGGDVVWSRLDELKTGDFACLLPSALYGQDVDLSGFAAPKSGSFASISPPQRMTPALGRLLGYLVGDGAGPVRKGVVLSCADAEIINDQEQLLRAFFGYARSTPDRRRDALVAVRCGRVQARSFLEYIGYGFGGAEQKEVPWSILQSSKEVIVEFLRGYFETDGGPVLGSRGVEFSSKSKKLALQVHLLLLQLGIVGRLYPKVVPGYGTYWRWQAYGNDVVNFHRELGFISSRKQVTLRKIVASCRGASRAVPCQREKLREFYRNLPRRTRHTSDLFAARKTGKQVTERVLRLAVAYDPDNPVSAHFQNLLSAGYVYDKVTCLETSEAEVYDLNVPDGERFSGNGFVNHNTTLARILARAVLCQQLNLDDPEPCNECDNCAGVLNETSNAFVERDAASQGTVDHMRAVVDDLPFAVFNAPKRVYLFDECHRMSKDAQDVLLKPLEEKRMLGMFCTTEPEKIRGAIRTRCEEHQIRKITREDILGRMRMVLQQEGVEFEDDGVLTVIDFCGGGVRDVLNKLEMIAQMGPVTVESARSYLNLSIVSTFYEILLALPERTKEALELVDRACDRVTPEEVANGLAEAAMNSFRLANGMMADFAYADRALGQRVYETYQAQTAKVADYFVRSKYTTRIGLTCELVMMAQALRGGALPAVVVPAAPMFTPVAVSAPPVSAAPVQTAPAAVAAPPPVAAPPALKPGVRTDGVGNRGQDPYALTDLDIHGVPRQKPKQSAQAVPLNFGNDTRTSDDARKPLTPLEWRRQFEECIGLVRQGVSHGSA